MSLCVLLSVLPALLALLCDGYLVKQLNWQTAALLAAFHLLLVPVLGLLVEFILDAVIQVGHFDSNKIPKATVQFMLDG